MNRCVRLSVRSLTKTPLIGNCDPWLSGPSDSISPPDDTILRAGCMTKTETLDLNRLTDLASGCSAPQIPYLVYLARGRDVERPSVIVLLDSDTAGDAARKDIERGGKASENF